MKKVLLTEYFAHPDIDRAKELAACLQQNIANPHIDRVILVAEMHSMIPGSILSSRKVKPVYNTGRATFSRFFELVNVIHRPGTIYIIANLDIAFDDTLQLLDRVEWNDTFACVTRWNLKGYCGTPEGQPLSEDTLQWNPSDSHDCWITGQPVKQQVLQFTDFAMGIPGCDGKLCYHLQQAGYKTINPCEEIKTYHMHLTGGYSGHRTYTERSRLPKPYGQVGKTKLQ